jgi:hypothetical protein
VPPHSTPKPAERRVTTDLFVEKSFDEKVGRHLAWVRQTAHMRRHDKVAGDLADTPLFGVPPRLTVTLPSRRLRGARGTVHQ